MMEIAGKMMTFTNGALRLAGMSWGNPKLPPVLAIHGWLDNVASFSRLAPGLAHTHHVVAFDLPGHGHSSHRDWSHPYDALTHVHAATDVASQLGWLQSGKKFSVIGHSMGGAIACGLAASLSNIEKLVVIDGFGFVVRSDDSAALHLRACIAHRLRIKDRGPRSYSSLDAAVAARIEKVTSFPGKQSISWEAAQVIMERACLTDEESGRVYLQHDPLVSCNQQSYFNEAQVRSILSHITCPTLVLTAENGWPLSNVSDSEERFRALGKSLYRHARMPGSHHCHLDPETSGYVLAECRRFLTPDHPPPRSTPSASIEEKGHL